MDANSIPEFSDKRERKVDGGTRLHLVICQILPTNASVKTFFNLTPLRLSYICRKDYILGKLRSSFFEKFDSDL